MLRIYRRFWQVNWAEQWQYRANYLMYLFYWLVAPIVYLAVWTSIARSQGSVRGLTANDFVLYYLTLLVIDQITSDITIHLFAYKIQDGTLAGELLRPVHPLLTNTLMNNLSMKLMNLLVLAPIWGALYLLFGADYPPISPANLLLALPAVAIGFAISFLSGAAITCLAFWTTRIYSLMEFYGALHVLFSGAFVPLSLMPPLIQQIASFLPFQLVLYFPIQLVLGQLSPAQIGTNFLLGGFWLLVWLLAFRLVWRAGVKRFSAVGA
jgi:ABC-2 type transport system permease protein